MPHYGMADTGQDISKRGRSRKIPPAACDHGCGQPALFCSSKGVWRCAESPYACPKVIEGKTGVNNPFYGRHTTDEMRSKFRVSLGDKRCGAGNPIFGTKRSDATRQKISRTRVLLGSARGHNNPNWHGGHAGNARAARLCDMATTRYKDWRKAVYTRDNYTCQFCGAHNGNGVAVILHADHIKPYAAFPELRYDVANGRTLCRKCHGTTFKENIRLIKQARHERN